MRNTKKKIKSLHITKRRKVTSWCKLRKLSANTMNMILYICYSSNSRYTRFDLIP